MNSRLHRWWLWGCFAALLLASWAGGFGVAVTAVFIGIYLTGLVLIGPDEPEAEAEEAAVPYPDDEETETSHSDTDGDTDGDTGTGTDADADADENLESSDSSRS